MWGVSVEMENSLFFIEIDNMWGVSVEIENSLVVS